MSTRYNFFGGLVTDGLILNLDAAKLQSYPGSGTNWINLINNSISGGTLINGPTLTGSGKNLAITFDGTNDYTEILDNSIIDFGTSDFTSNIWIYPNSSLIGNAEYGIINKNSGFQNSTGWGLELSTYGYSLPFPKVDIIGFNSVQSSWGNSNVLASIITNAWSNVNLIRTGNKFDLYVNGSLSKTKINSNVGLNVDNSVNLTLGKSSSWQSYFKGNISNFNLFNRALSPFDIFQNFNTYKSRYGIPDIVTSGLTLNLDAGNPYSYNPLNTGSTTWTDVSSNGNNSTLTNGTYYSDGTMVFDGVDDYVNVPTFSLPVSSFSCEAFFQWSNLGSDRGSIFSLNYNYPNSGYLIRQKDDGSGKFVIWSDYGSESGIYSTASLIVNTWNHVVVVQSAGTCLIYINGILDSSQSLPNPVLNQSYPILLGTRALTGSVGAFLTGKISVSKIYNRALSATEVSQNFNALRGRYGI
jgi:hypothetical protein